jgi:hypothetical protein
MDRGLEKVKQKYAEEDAKIEAEKLAADKLANPEKYADEEPEIPPKPEIATVGTFVS